MHLHISVYVYGAAQKSLYRIVWNIKALTVACCMYAGIGLYAYAFIVYIYVYIYIYIYACK
jgi:hypothetical protein